MSVLASKRNRDLLRLKGQVATIGLVLACGVMAMIMIRGTFGSLLRARDAYFTHQRFPDVFARLERAPATLAPRLERIPGVATSYTRVVKDVMIPMPDDPDPITGRIVSIPTGDAPPLCGLVLRAGRMPAPNAPDEAVVIEQFAIAHNIHTDDRLPAVLGGTLHHLRVVGIGLSPEYLFPLSGRVPIADERRFVVMWMHRDIIAPIFRMEGAFNDVLLRLQPGASMPDVLAAVDRELAPYGGYHAISRDKQASNYVLENELGHLRSLSLMIPTVFLAVAAFLVNVVISRLVYLERTQIAILKALGRWRREIILHYLGLVALVVAIGTLLGVALGVWAGRWMTHLYTRLFKFPSGDYELSTSLLSTTFAVALVAALGGAINAVWRVTRLPAAEAMRPAAPPIYHETIGGLGRVLGPSVTMIAREIMRRPARFLFSTAAIAMGIGIYIIGHFQFDSFGRLFNEDFVRGHREDMVVNLDRARPERAVRELANLPGVELAEGTREVPVRFHSAGHWRDTIIIGLPSPSELRHLLHQRTTELTPPPEGILMTRKLAEILELRVGDRVTAEIADNDWPTRSLTVGGLIDEPLGLQTYARNDWLATFLREEPRVNSVLLRIDPMRADDVRARLRDMPQVIGTSSTSRIIDRYRAQTGQSIGVITIILTLSAAAIAIGVVYNNARIVLSQRSRDLASLRVLGFTRREISAILLGELGAQVLVGVPLGLVFGNLWARLFASLATSETMRFPFYIHPQTYAAAAVIAVSAGVVSALLVRRRLDDLDLIAVLKASE